MEGDEDGVIYMFRDHAALAHGVGMSSDITVRNHPR